MNTTKEHSCPYCHASATLGAVYYDQNCAGCVKRMSAPEPVSMEPVHQFRKWGCSDWYDGVADHTDGHGPYEERELYTATQLAAARQQGAEEERKKRLDWAVAWKELDVNVLHSRIAELEQKNAQLLEALKAAYKIAVDQDNSKPVDWALYCEFLYQSIKAAEVKP